MEFSLKLLFIESSLLVRHYGKFFILTGSSHVDSPQLTNVGVISMSLSDEVDHYRHTALKIPSGCRTLGRSA